MPVSKEVAAQIDAAFDYRGHVTVALGDGTKIEGFLFNRELAPSKGEAYIEIIPKDTDERRRIPADAVVGVTLTGKDFASPFVPPAR